MSTITINRAFHPRCCSCLIYKECQFWEGFERWLRRLGIPWAVLDNMFTYACRQRHLKERASEQEED